MSKSDTFKLDSVNLVYFFLSLLSLFISPQGDKLTTLGIKFFIPLSKENKTYSIPSEYTLRNKLILQNQFGLISYYAAKVKVCSEK